MFFCNLPPVCLAECLGSFMCHHRNKGLELTPSESSQKVNFGKENSPARTQSRNLLITNPVLYEQVMPVNNQSPNKTEENSKKLFNS